MGLKSAIPDPEFRPHLRGLPLSLHPPSKHLSPRIKPDSFLKPTIFRPTTDAQDGRVCPPPAAPPPSAAGPHLTPASTIITAPPPRPNPPSHHHDHRHRGHGHRHRRRRRHHHGHHHGGHHDHRHLPRPRRRRWLRSSRRFSSSCSSRPSVFVHFSTRFFSPFLHLSDSFRPFPRAVLPVKGLAMNCAASFRFRA